MVHAGHGEEAVEVIHGERGVRARERVHRLVVVQAVPGADQLVRPADVVQHLPVVRRVCERSQVRGDRLPRVMF